MSSFLATFPCDSIDNDMTKILNNVIFYLYQKDLVLKN